MHPKIVAIMLACTILLSDYKRNIVYNIYDSLHSLGSTVNTYTNKIKNLSIKQLIIISIITICS